MNKKKTMWTVVILTCLFNLLFILNLVYCLYADFLGWQFSTFITFFMLAYHFDIRLLIGWFFTRFIKRHINIESRIYVVTDKQYALYNKLKVRKWKDKYFAMDKSQFVMTNNLDVILKNNICAELSHICCVIFSFLSIFFGCLLSTDEWWIYVLTSVFSSIVVDIMPIIIQRFNRYRLQKLYNIKNKKEW